MPYTNSKGQEVSKVWHELLQAGRAVGRIGKATGRAVAQIFNRISRSLFRAIKKFGPEAMQILYGLVVQAAGLKMSGPAKFVWVIDKAKEVIGDKIEEASKTELNAIINGIVLDLKDSGKIE